MRIESYPETIAVRRRAGVISGIWAVAVIALVVIGLRLTTLGVPNITDPTEARYAAVAAEMARSGDWITLRTHVRSELVPFLGKPPLHAWLTAASLKLFGLNEAAARLPSLLSTIIYCAASGYFALAFFGVEIALLALLFLSTSFLLFMLSGSCMTDPLLTLCMSGTMLSFAFAVDGRPPYVANRRAWGYGFFFFLALGMLTKGPVAIAIPVLALGGWMLFNKRLADLRSLPWLPGLLLFFAICVPWYVLAEIHNPGFLQYFFINENLLRYFMQNYGDLYGSGHRYPRGMIWAMLMMSALPWTFLLLFIPFRKSFFRSISEAHRPWLSFVVFWIASTLLVFSPAKQISPAYALPALPPFAILIALLIKQSTEELEFVRVRWMFNFTGLVGIFGSLGMLGVGIANGLGAGTTIYCALLVVVCGNMVTHLFRSRRLLPIASYAAASIMLLYSSGLLALAPQLNEEISAKEMIDYFQATSPKASIAFLNRVPHSAFFYANRDNLELRFEFVGFDDVQSVKEDYLAADEHDLLKLPPEALLGFRMVTEIGNWGIYRRSSVPSDGTSASRPL